MVYFLLQKLPTPDNGFNSKVKGVAVEDADSAVDVANLAKLSSHFCSTISDLGQYLSSTNSLSS